jgi:tetratricopeptide (TPR) repeat protein/GGDEF domain-containing protein
MSFSVISTERTLSQKDRLIDQVELLFTKDDEKLNYDEVLTLSNKIIIQREEYPNEIIAKTYLLLSHVTSNKGELETAYQFVQDGLAARPGQKQVKWCLQIKLASILSAKKRYKQLLATAQQAIEMPQDKENIRYLLFALSYRSVAYAMLNQYENALNDLQKVESIIKENPLFAEHIALLTILANTYYHLTDYQTALTMNLKILQLRFRLKKLDNVEQTYYHLANTYYRLNRFNDAYNAFWESKRYAKNKSSKIHMAYASQGLGLTLIKQKQLTNAKAELEQAKRLFYYNNLSAPYLETIVSLALISNLTNDKHTEFSLLQEAEDLTSNLTNELSDDYIILYQLLAEYFIDKNQINEAYFWQKKYSTSLLKSKKVFKSNTSQTTKHTIKSAKSANILASAKTRDLAVKIAEQSASAATYSAKNDQQKNLIFILSTLAFLLLCSVIFLWLKDRAKKFQKAHDAIEKPSDVIATPVQTKELYEQNFNMARKYSYPLTLSYISISNWQELTFQFNKKIVNEVTREIASVINKHINEFESAGLVNEGEYLLIFPHQHKKEVSQVIEKLVLDIKLRFFANLGEFSVIIAYAIESPNFQDIDPYIYLSQLSDSIKIA